MDNFLERVPLSHRVVGYRQVVRGIHGNQLRCVLIARDADSFIGEQLALLCKQNNVPYEFVLDKQTMGKMLELDVPCAVCAESKEAKKVK